MAPRLIWIVEQGSQRASLLAHQGEGHAQPVCLDPYPQTPETIASAKAARDAERAEITAKTGLVIHEDGRITKPQIDPWLAGGVN